MEIGHHHFAVQAALAVFRAYAALPEEPSAFLVQLDRPCSWTADMSLVDPVTGQIGGYLHKIGVVGPELIRMVDGGQR